MPSFCSHPQWDQCTANALKEQGMVSIFPHMPRSVHVPYASGKHAPLAGLELNVEPVNITLLDLSRAPYVLYGLNI